MKRAYWHLAIIAVPVLIILGLQEYGALPPKYQDLEGLVLTAPDESKSKLNLAQKPYTVVIGWAHWCQPCMSSMPYYNELEKKFKGKFQFYGIHFDPISGNELRDLKDKHDITFPIYRVNKTPKSIWRIGKVPYMLIFTRKGTLLIELAGTKDKKRGERLMERLAGIVE